MCAVHNSYKRSRQNKSFQSCLRQKSQEFATHVPIRASELNSNDYQTDLFSKRINVNVSINDVWHCLFIYRNYLVILFFIRIISRYFSTHLFIACIFICRVHLLLFTLLSAYIFISSRSGESWIACWLILFNTLKLLRVKSFFYWRACSKIGNLAKWQNQMKVGTSIYRQTWHSTQ